MKKLKICLGLLLMAALLCGSALAAASVTYEGGAEKFVFLPGSSYSDTDLFENFKGVLPGDVLTQTITVQNDTDAQVRIYMRAEPVKQEDVDFLNQMHMTVTSGSKEIFDAQADQQDGLAKNTLLGTFKKSGSTTLTVTLEVPIEMGNEYMGRIGTVPWTFLVEEVPEEDTPETGDWFRPALWCGAAVLLAACIVLILLARRRRQAEEN